jgi:hypothetical protein
VNYSVEYFVSTEFTVAMSAETLALAFTSFRCNGPVATSQVGQCYAGRQFESKYALHLCIISHFLLGTLVLGSSGAQTKLVGFSTRDISYRSARNICARPYNVFACTYWPNSLHQFVDSCKTKHNYH